MGAIVEGLVLTDPLPEPEPGVYIAAAQDPAYGWLKSLTVAGTARLVGERYEVDGRKLIAVEIPGAVMAANQRAVRYRIGKAFFSAALDDYREWREKWWREAVQNAVDAGATRVDCKVEAVPEGMAVSCADNGRGMDADTIENKFLVGGETTKTGASGEAGGFGKAKELLILPWIAWSIHSRSARFYGSGDEGMMDDASHRDGTELRVIMPADKTTDAAAAIAFISKCNLPHVRFTVNGEPVAAALTGGDEIRDFAGKAVLFHNKEAPKGYKVLVRTKGLYMFSFAWLSSAIPGQLLLELVGHSKELLTANRDSFRDEQLGQAVDEFVRQVSVDTDSALEKKKNHFHLKFQGTGKFRGAPQRELESEMLSHLEEIVPAAKSGRASAMSTEQITVITRVLSQLSGGESASEEKGSGPLNMRATAAVATAMLEGIPMGGTDAVEAAIKQLSWEPDFFMTNKVDGFDPPKMFYPDTMSPSMRKLAKLWAELCRFVLIQLGSTSTFGVGWIFAEHRGAEYQMLPDSDEHWLLLNPFKSPRHRDYAKKPAKEDLYSASDDDDVNWLYAAAIHECTHMADGVDEHDEAFASAFTRNVAKIAGKDRQIRAIRKAVVARGPRAEGGAPREKKAPAFSPLADAALEKARQEAAWEGGAEYVLFTYENESSTDSSSSEQVLVGQAERQYGHSPAEIRKAGGKVVWRNESFDLPLAEKRGKKSGVLPPLYNIELERERQSTARRYADDGTSYVSFKQDRTDAWDYSNDLARLVKTCEDDTYGTVYFEIRESATGKPIWRSKNFLRYESVVEGYAANQSDEDDSEPHSWKPNRQAEAMQWHRKPTGGLCDVCGCGGKLRKGVEHRALTADEAHKSQAAYIKRISDAYGRDTLQWALDVDGAPLHQGVEDLP